MICYRGGKEREAEGTGKRSKASAKIGKFLSLSLSKIFEGCPFKISYKYNEKEKVLTYNEKNSNLASNHQLDDKLKSKQLDQKAKDFMISVAKQKHITTKDMKEKLEDKFGISFDYQSVANSQRKVETSLFGNPADDAFQMKQLILKLKDKFPDFLGEILQDSESHELKGLIYATPMQKKLAEIYMDLLVMDTTFGTNRFKMKHWTRASASYTVPL